MTLPVPVQLLLEATFPGMALLDPAPTFGGFSNLTLSLTVGAEPCIIKAATLAHKRADLQREAFFLSMLSGSGLPIASLYRLIESECWTIELLHALPGENAIRRLTDPIDTLKPLFTQLGQLLARVHTLALPPPQDSDLLLAERAVSVGRALPALTAETTATGYV